MVLVLAGGRDRGRGVRALVGPGARPVPRRRGDRPAGGLARPVAGGGWGLADLPRARRGPHRAPGRGAGLPGLPDPSADRGRVPGRAPRPIRLVLVARVLGPVRDLAWPLGRRDAGGPALRAGVVPAAGAL